MSGTNGKKRTKNRTNINTSEKTKTYGVKGIKNKKVKKSKKKNKFLKFLKWLILSLFILGILAVILGLGIIVGIFTSDKYKVSEEKLNEEFGQNSQVYFRDGTYKTELAGDEKRREISIEDMGPYIPNAFIAIEDERFRSHQGIDIKRTVGATVKFIISRGKSSFGGSTITQQLIKNIYEDKADEGVDGIQRKIREMARAYNLEKIWSKDQILEKYLNYIYMGGYSKNIMGVEMGAEYYFNKSAKDVTLAEAAFLAGINNTPNSYDPFSTTEDNSELIKRRTTDVLWKMKELGHIESEEEYNSAIEEVEAGLKFSEGKIASDVSYSYVTAAAIKQAANQLVKEKGWSYNYAKNKIESGGYKIYTTEDPSIQGIMEAEFVKNKYIEQPRTKKSDGTLLNKGHTQASMVVIDHKTGQVVGCMGGLGEDSTPLGLNRVTDGHSQPGSSIKPIAVIAPALEKGIITAGTVYDDSKTWFGNYDPHNSDGYHGLMAIRTALAKSSNIVHVKIMRELGPANSMEFLSKLGINVDKTYEDLTLALGTPSLTSLEMAGAYAAIANGGVYIEPTFFTKIEDSDGNIVIEAKQEKRRVLSEENAYIMQELLTAPARSGTASVVYMSNMDVGAKTGSSNGYKDRWLCGFTPYYTAASWYGFDNAERPASGANHAANIWAAVMKSVHSNLSTKRFEKPNNNVISAKICLDSGCSATEECTNTTSELFVKGTVPKACEGHTKLKICKETGKIANEYCTDVEEKTYTKKPAKEETTLWKTDEGDKYTVPTESCDVHKKPEEKIVVVPSLIGKTAENAKSELEKLNLKVSIKYEEDKTKQDGVVIHQSVSEKQEVKENTTITITVNKKNETSGGNTNTVNTNTQTGTNTNTTNNEVVN